MPLRGLTREAGGVSLEFALRDYRSIVAALQHLKAQMEGSEGAAASAAARPKEALRLRGLPDLPLRARRKHGSRAGILPSVTGGLHCSPGCRPESRRRAL